MTEQIKDNKKDKKDKKKEEDLSLEDKQLKEKIQFYVTKLIDKDRSESISGLNSLKIMVKQATGTMTSVPKPFKFLKAHYKDIANYFPSLEDSDYKKQFSDFLSVLAMIFADKLSRASLSYLLQGTQNQYKSWGHEYLSHIASDIGKEFDIRIQNNEPYQQLITIVNVIVPYFIQNNAEHDAIDLLMIVDKLEDIKKYVTRANFSKIHLYLSSSIAYSADEDEWIKTLTILYQIALELEEYTIALRVAIKLDDHEKIIHLFSDCPDDLIKKQLAFNVARQKIFIQDLNEQQTKIISNNLLSQYYVKLSQNLEVNQPKKPQQIFKAHLQQKSKNPDINSSQVALYNTYVNAFVNAGLKKDTLMIDDPDSQQKKQPWIYQVKQQGQIAAVASLGILNSWYSECINDQIMPYLDNQGSFVKAGACLGIGLCSAGINDENDIAFALLEQHISSEIPIIKSCSILSLGMAYASRSREEILTPFTEIILNSTSTIQHSAFAALSLGLIYVGKCSEQVSTTIIQSLLEKSNEQLNHHWAKLYGIALGLIFMGQQAKCEGILQMIQTMQHPIKKFYEIMIQSIAYVGSGNVLKVQKMSNTYVSGVKYSDVALLGLTLIASSQEIGNQMAMRLINHALHFSTPQTKKIIPLALAVLNLSNPRITVVDILQRLAYDTDQQLACKAIFALGIVGSGTNNSRLADIFRKLAGYYFRQNNIVFSIRLAQGLLYMGKGMLTIQPYYSERFLMSKVGMSGLIIFLTCLLDINQTILGKYHYFIYFLSLSMYPKFLFLLDDKLQQLTINVRVGQAVDVVGQAGKPKKITGFQTHQAPVLISHGQRVQLATQQFIPIQDMVLQNFVILQKNPSYVPPEERPRKKTSL